MQKEDLVSLTETLLQTQRGIAVGLSNRIVSMHVVTVHNQHTGQPSYQQLPGKHGQEPPALAQMVQTISFSQGELEAWRCLLYSNKKREVGLKVGNEP